MLSWYNTGMNISLFDFPTAYAIYFLVLTGVLGLVMGSFCNAWAWRLANNEKITHGRSHCTSCGHTLSPLDLVPLFSWLFLKGRCRYCGEKISARYPITELISMLIYLTALLRFGFSLDTVRFMLLGSFLLTASLVDIDIMEIPDRLLLFSSFAALLRLAVNADAWKPMLLGFFGVSVPLLIVVLIMEYIIKRTAMGGGDIKLIAVLGLHFGILQTLYLLIISCFVGLAAAFLSGRGAGKEFPFGPSIAIAAWITMLTGQQVITAYLSLF